MYTSNVCNTVEQTKPLHIILKYKLSRIHVSTLNNNKILCIYSIDVCNEMMIIYIIEDVKIKKVPFQFSNNTAFIQFN